MKGIVPVLITGFAMWSVVFFISYKAFFAAIKNMRASLVLANSGNYETLSFLARLWAILYYGDFLSRIVVVTSVYGLWVSSQALGIYCDVALKLILILQD